MRLTRDADVSNLARERIRNAGLRCSSGALAREFGRSFVGQRQVRMPASPRSPVGSTASDGPPASPPASAPHWPSRRYSPRAFRSLGPPGLRHEQPDDRQAEGGNAGEAGEGDAVAEGVADIARQHGAQGCADTSRGADDALREIEVAGAEGDVGHDQRDHHAEHRRGDAVEHLYATRR